MTNASTCVQCSAANKPGIDYCQWCGKPLPGVDPNKPRPAIPKPDLAFAANIVADEPGWNTQDQVNALLRRGVFFSIMWLGGIGSALAVISAWKARRLIRTSPTKLKGAARLWWCFVVGGVGVLLFVLSIIGIARVSLFSPN